MELLIGLSIGGGLSIAFAGYVGGTYNTLQKGKNEYAGQLADINAEYQRRADLYFNLAKTVKSFKKHESDVLTAVTKARSGITTSGKLDPKKMNKLDTMFSGLRLQFEAYPDLKSNIHYSSLMDEIKKTEERIISARAELNDIAEDFNKYIDMFPRNLVAKGMFSAKKLEYFKTTTRAKSEPNIDL